MITYCKHVLLVVLTLLILSIQPVFAQIETAEPEDEGVGRLTDITVASILPELMEKEYGFLGNVSLSESVPVGNTQKVKFFIEADSTDPTKLLFGTCQMRRYQGKLIVEGKVIVEGAKKRAEAIFEGGIFWSVETSYEVRSDHEGKSDEELAEAFPRPISLDVPTGSGRLYKDNLFLSDGSETVAATLVFDYKTDQLPKKISLVIAGKAFTFDEIDVEDENEAEVLPGSDEATAKGDAFTEALNDLNEHGNWFPASVEIPKDLVVLLQWDKFLTSQDFVLPHVMFIQNREDSTTDVQVSLVFSAISLESLATFIDVKGLKTTELSPAPGDLIADNTVVDMNQYTVGTMTR